MLPNHKVQTLKGLYGVVELTLWLGNVSLDGILNLLDVQQAANALTACRVSIFPILSRHGLFANWFEQCRLDDSRETLSLPVNQLVWLTWHNRGISHTLSATGSACCGHGIW